MRARYRGVVFGRVSLGARCFVPKGRTSATIYAVVLKEHPTVVKLGRASRWYQRRVVYDNWNHAPGDGVLEFVAYCVTRAQLEQFFADAACLAAMNRPLFRGTEWFRADLDHAKFVIQQVISQADLSYIDITDDPKSAAKPLPNIRRVR